MPAITNPSSSYFTEWGFFKAGDDTLQRIIEAGADSDSQKTLKNLSPQMVVDPLPNGELPLHYAIRKKALPVVEWILSQPHIELDQKDHQGLTALDHAFIDSNQSIQKLVFNRYMNEGSLVHDIPAPLSHRDYESAKCSIKEEGDAHGGLQGQFKLQELKFFSDTYLNRSIAISAGKNTTYLMSAIAQGDREAIEFLLSKKIDIGQKVDGPSIRYPCNSSPLHLAAFKGDLRTIELLIQKGADVNVPDASGYTPIHYAITNRNFGAIKILIKQRANFVSGTSSPLTFLMADASHRDPLRLSSYDLLAFCFAVVGYASSQYITDQNALQKALGIHFVTQAVISFAVGIWENNLSERDFVFSKLAVAAMIGAGKIDRFGLYIDAMITTYIACKKLAGSWKNRHVDGWRSIRNAMIQSVNTITPAFTIYKAVFASPIATGAKSAINNGAEQKVSGYYKQKMFILCRRLWEEETNMCPAPTFPTNIKEQAFIDSCTKSLKKVMDALK